jgi:HEAT repeat protein
MVDEKLSMNEALENLSSDDVATRKLAVNSLEGVTDEVAINPLIEATTDESAPVRFKAAEILGTMGDVAVGKLIDRFGEEEGQNKRFITYALKQTGDEKVIPYLVEAVEDEDAIVRKVAVRGLGELKAVNQIDSISKGLTDDDWGVRLAGIRSLGDLGTEESIDLIKKARRKEKDKDFKKACNKSIQKAEDAVIPKKFAMLVENNIVDMSEDELGSTPKKRLKAMKKIVKQNKDFFKK